MALQHCPNQDLNNFIDAMIAERDRQDLLWGVGQQVDPDKFISILVEEVGEVAKELNETRDADALRVELVQVAAVCAKFAEWGLQHLDEPSS